MKRFRSWIQRAYIRAVLFFIGPALRAEQESRAEELRTLGSQISVVVDKKLSEYVAQSPRPSEKVSREAACPIRSERTFVVSGADLGPVETRRYEASELCAVVRQPAQELVSG